MENDKSKVPIYIAIIVGLILVAAGGYFMLDGSKIENNMRDDKSQTSRSNTYSPADDSKLYYFVDRGNDIITIEVKGVATTGDGYRDYYIDPLEDGYSFLRSKCKVVDRQILPSYEGRVVAYSITTEGTCYLK